MHICLHIYIHTYTYIYIHIHTYTPTEPYTHIFWGEKQKPIYFLSTTKKDIYLQKNLSIFHIS